MNTKQISFFLSLICFASVNTGPINYGEIVDTFVGTSKAHPVTDLMEHVKLIEVGSDDATPYRFFGVHETDQERVDFQKLKQKLSESMNISTDQTVQIVGDSGKFSEEGTKKGRAFLRKLIDQAHLVEYGFTGYKSDDGRELDINSFVNEYVDEQPTVARKVLANILGHTHIALTQWGTYGSPRVRNYMVIYNDCDMSKQPTYVDAKKVSGFTTFGNDIITSDHLLRTTDGDRFVCLEGGVQSFLQIINALSLKTPSILVYNLRKPEKEKFFSATRFLKLVRNASVGKEPPTQEKVQELFVEYEKTLDSIWDPSKADSKTKKELFDVAMSRFVDDELYKEVPSLCTILDAKELPE